MTKLHKNSSGFTVIEVLLVILTLAIIGVVGYFVADHIDKKTSKPVVSNNNQNAQNPGTYKFEGEAYPIMPSGFKLAYQGPDNRDENSEAIYITNLPVKNINTDIVMACQSNGYSAPNPDTLFANDAAQCVNNTDLEWDISYSALNAPSSSGLTKYYPQINKAAIGKNPSTNYWLEISNLLLTSSQLVPAINTQVH